MLTFCIGFLVGGFFGITIMAIMALGEQVDTLTYKH